MHVSLKAGVANILKWLIRTNRSELNNHSALFVRIYIPTIHIDHPRKGLSTTKPSVVNVNV